MKGTFYLSTIKFNIFIRHLRDIDWKLRHLVHCLRQSDTRYPQALCCTRSPKHRENRIDKGLALLDPKFEACSCYGPLLDWRVPRGLYGPPNTQGTKQISPISPYARFLVGRQDMSSDINNNKRQQHERHFCSSFVYLKKIWVGWFTDGSIGLGETKLFFFISQMWWVGRFRRGSVGLGETKLYFFFPQMWWVGRFTRGSVGLGETQVLFYLALLCHFSQSRQLYFNFVSIAYNFESTFKGAIYNFTQGS